MPSPVGHALASVAVGWAVAGRVRPDRAAWVQAGVFAAVGIAPDLDLFIGRHSAETHSIGAAVIVAAVAAWRRWPVTNVRWRIWLAIFLAWGIHPLLDAMAPDTSPPIGVMLLWPFSTGYYNTGVELFAPISRRWWLPGFTLHNVLAVLREALILGPILGAVWALRRREDDTRKVRVRRQYL
jgi:membrane-bound metal-dependent hydrolase YbcI (DUF457 family)